MKHRSGFTIVELLVVVSLVSLLMSLAVPAVQQARQSAQRLQCRNNLRQIVIALSNYETVSRCFPPGMQVQNFQGATPFSKSFAWTIPLLPFLDQAQLFSQFDTDWDAQIHHRSLTSAGIATYQCPSDPMDGGIVMPRRSHAVWGNFEQGAWGTTDYLGISGTTTAGPVDQPLDCDSRDAQAGRRLHCGMCYGNSAVRFADVLDGASNTFFIGERAIAGKWGRWAGPGDIGTCPMGFGDVLIPGMTTDLAATSAIQIPQSADSAHKFWWSWHDGGTHFAMVDGSVHFFSYSTDNAIVLSRTTRAALD